jgi:2-phosphosulfolactate phosphatase
MMNSIEVVLSPALFPYRVQQSGIVTVVIDVLRATSAFNAVFDAGAHSILPVGDLQLLLALQKEGFLTAAERDGKKVDFADFGNSPTQFLEASLSQVSIAYSTTNGTQSLLLAKEAGPVITAAFTNVGRAVSFLQMQSSPIVILCSGWKNNPSLEDTLCAGAIINHLSLDSQIELVGDTALMALELWNNHQNHIADFCSQGSHYQRLLNAGLQSDLEHCFRLNISNSLPVLTKDVLLNHEATH